MARSTAAFAGLQAAALLLALFAPTVLASGYTAGYGGGYGYGYGDDDDRHPVDCVEVPNDDGGYAYGYGGYGGGYGGTHLECGYYGYGGTDTVTDVMPAPTTDTEQLAGAGITEATFTIECTGASVPTSNRRSLQQSQYPTYLVYIVFETGFTAANLQDSDLRCTTQTGELIKNDVTIGTIFNNESEEEGLEQIADISVAVPATGIGSQVVAAINCPTQAAYDLADNRPNYNIAPSSDTAITQFVFTAVDVLRADPDSLPASFGAVTQSEEYTMPDAAVEAITAAAAANAEYAALATDAEKFDAFFSDSLAQSYYDTLVARDPSLSSIPLAAFDCAVSSAAARRRTLLQTTASNSMTITGGSALAAAIATSLNAVNDDPAATAALLGALAASLGITADQLARVVTARASMTCNTAQLQDCVWTSTAYSACTYTNAVPADVPNKCRQVRTNTITTAAGQCSFVQCPDTTQYLGGLSGIVAPGNSCPVQEADNTCPAATSTPVTSNGDGDDGLSGGAIAGIVVGSVGGTALLVGAGVGGYMYHQKRVSKQNISAGGYMTQGDDALAASGGASYTAVQVGGPAPAAESTMVEAVRLP